MSTGTGMSTGVMPTCSPGETVCVNDLEYMECGEDGDFGPSLPCDRGDVCVVDQCITSACAHAAAQGDTTGCEFWVSELPNTWLDGALVAMIVNPDDASTAEITVFDRAGEDGEQELISTSVPPGALTPVVLAGTYGEIEGAYLERIELDGSGVLGGRGLRIESDRPVQVTLQSNMGSPSFTEDSALLLPTHRLGSRYTAASWGEGVIEPEVLRGSFVVAVATRDNTLLQVTPTQTIESSATTPTMPAGQLTELALARHDVVYLQVPRPQDLSGTQIESNFPVALFSGHGCAFVPEKDTHYCDQLAEQLVPSGRWGSDYIAARAASRGEGDVYYWRVTAREDGTTVEFDPQIEIGALVTLDAGESHEFTADEATHVHASAPVQLVGYQRGGGDYEANDGDPHMVQMPATNRFRREHVVYTTAEYTDYARVIRPAGAAVTVECLGALAPELWKPVANGDFEVALVTLEGDDCETGPQRVVSDEPIGLVVSGNQEAMSYAHAAHL